ncbi:uncharacterized protein Nmag_0275 [Natrialba magadii ATCC 43099]|uniref:Uncharacterized protein n=1 Tax=Natrialba magadii (strain ATCC 43099 / DSM 3394 / CCM 3739 / CIP 104546 / IAM 13178 / JCM 8861 / NBRC 102185 / NCIMB 2190 / MS3) TaxID=547559 RepID=D3SX47_NATMM|nr:hypothetical protein [Natrialba magadii]ADD03867.1 uncharacterized protein Nmag_0275 [Natrialba magadii ATCC 43099]ELY33528.1 hypothetical protein C500_01810 [Natrialba magadii ATCC 43099]
MSSDLEHGERDLAAELQSPAAGQVGIPVDAICVGCGQTRVKRAPLAEVSKDLSKDPTELEAEDLTSLKHVCHRCGSATWWNVVAVLSGLLEQERGEEA